MSWSDPIMARATATSRAERFAGAVAARHRGDPAAWLRCSTRTNGVVRVVVHRRRVASRSGSASFILAPRVELRLVLASAGVRDVAARASTRFAALAVEPRTASAPSAASILQRAATRALRDDGHASPSSASPRERVARLSASGEAVPASHRSAVPARVLRRRAPVPAEPAVTAREARPARAAAPPSQAAPLSPVEINRLTDHIVQTIDRRIAAFRERRGRV